MPGIWVQTQTLTVSDGGVGSSVAIRGSTIVLGAFGDNSTQGAAYVFERYGGSWVQAQKLTASDGEPGDFFGNVAVSGSTIVVGAPNDRIGDNFGQGSAYVFERHGGSWVQAQKLTAGDGAPNDQFGQAVAVDGSTIAVTTLFDVPGSAHVFERHGGSWVQAQKLTASGGGLIGAVAVEGSTIVLGAPFESIGGNDVQGAAHVFERRGGSWIETQRLTASDGVADDLFGVSVAISGSTIVLGAQGSNINGEAAQGAAYVFERRGGDWVQTQKLIASDGATGDLFGGLAAISGSIVVVGAWGDDAFKGSAYVFKL